MIDGKGKQQNWLFLISKIAMYHKVSPKVYFSKGASENKQIKPF